MNVFVKILKAIQWLMAVNSMYWLKVVFSKLSKGRWSSCRNHGLVLCYASIGAEHVLNNGKNMEPKVYVLPRELDEEVAKLNYTPWATI